MSNLFNFINVFVAQAAGDLIILSHPKSISYKGHEHIEESTLKEMYSAALGFTVEQVIIYFAYLSIVILNFYYNVI